MVFGQMKLDLGMRQKPQPLSNFLRDSDLSLGGDSHGITPFSKTNKIFLYLKKTGVAYYSVLRTLK